MITAVKILVATGLLFSSSLAFAKGANELESSFSFLDGKSQTDDGMVHSTEMILNGAYLRLLGSYWLGGELTYDMYESDTTSRTTMIIGVPFKYWLKGPDSKGVGLYGFSTPYFGKLDNGIEAGTVFGLKLGPSLVAFLSDMVGVDTKLVYDYRKTSGQTSTTTGLLVGFSIFF